MLPGGSGCAPGRAFPRLCISFENHHGRTTRTHTQTTWNSGKKAIWTLSHDSDRRPSRTPGAPRGRGQGKVGRARGSSLLHPGRDLAVPSCSASAGGEGNSALLSGLSYAEDACVEHLIFMSTCSPSVGFCAFLPCPCTRWGRVAKQSVHFPRSRWPAS